MTNRQRYDAWQIERAESNDAKIAWQVEQLGKEIGTIHCKLDAMIEKNRQPIADIFKPMRRLIKNLR